MQIWSVGFLLRYILIAAIFYLDYIDHKVSIFFLISVLTVAITLDSTQECLSALV